MPPKKDTLEGEATPTSGVSSKDVPGAEEICREWVFGMRAEVSEAVTHLDDYRVLYPAGHSLVIYEVSEPSQSFVPLEGGNSLVSLALSEKR